MKKLLLSFLFIYALSLVGMEPEKLTYLGALLKNPKPMEYNLEQKKILNLLDSKQNTKMLALQLITDKTSKNKEQNLDEQPKKLRYKNAPSIKPPSKKTNQPLQKIPNPQQKKSKEKNINLDTLKPKLVFRDLPCDFDDIP